MPFDPKGVATQLVNEKLGGDGKEQGEEQDMAHEMWRDLIDAIHSKDPIAAANIHRGILDAYESSPHEEYEEGEE